jgi:hypothetical protein
MNGHNANIELRTWWDVIDEMWVTDFPDLTHSPQFKSRYPFWSKAHALKWLSDIAYLGKDLPADGPFDGPVDTDPLTER